MWWIRVCAAVAMRPSLWATAVGQLVTLSRPRWWARPPFLPLADPTYLRFRMSTVYGGDGTARPSPGEVVDFLEWCRAWPHLHSADPG